MENTQRGLSLLGVLVLLAIVAGAGYYLYQAISEVDGGPGCKDTHTSCMRYCRRTTIDTAEAQKCQANCQSQFDECSRQR